MYEHKMEGFSNHDIEQLLGLSVSKTMDIKIAVKTVIVSNVFFFLLSKLTVSRFPSIFSWYVGRHAPPNVTFQNLSNIFSVPRLNR